MDIGEFLAGWAYPREAWPEYWDMLKRWQHAPWYKRLFMRGVRWNLRVHAAEARARMYDWMVWP